MNILVTNDDGINADGLWTLANELRNVGNVTVVAPDREQSGVGTSISFHHPIRVTRIRDKIYGINTYSVEGTPADSVIMAIKVVMQGGIDLVVSGINQGPNCGYDIFISGTVGAALQGFFYCIPSIAVSVAAFEEPNFGVGAIVARELARYVRDRHITGKMLLNVNVPNLAIDEIRGIDVTRLGGKIYSAGIEAGHNGRHDYYWILHRGTDVELGSGTDIWSLEHNRISITPLRFSRSEYNTEFVHEMIPVITDRLLEKRIYNK